MLLKHPEAASKLPPDVQMLVDRHANGSLDQFLGKKPANSTKPTDGSSEAKPQQARPEAEKAEAAVEG